jgi:hypothetical protein
MDYAEEVPTALFVVAASTNASTALVSSTSASSSFSPVAVGCAAVALLSSVFESFVEGCLTDTHFSFLSLVAGSLIVATSASSDSESVSSVVVSVDEFSLSVTFLDSVVAGVAVSAGGVVVVSVDEAETTVAAAAARLAFLKARLASAAASTAASSAFFSSSCFFSFSFFSFSSFSFFSR